MISTDAIHYLRALVARGGPEEKDFAALTLVFAGVGGREQEVRDALSPTLTVETMQGFGFLKPHGYAGDYEMLERIYSRYHCTNPALRRWDCFFHAQSAPKAVRNRNDYFADLVTHLYRSKRRVRVLELASGPGRSVHDWLVIHPDADAYFECVEMDEQAIVHATELNRPFLDRVRFSRANLISFRPSGAYDLIWAAGICDYLSDRVFVALLRRMFASLAFDGELVFGNFSPSNPSRAYMEIVGAWVLNYRDEDRLLQLGSSAGIPPAALSIGKEPEGVNLFLHAKKAAPRSEAP